MFGNTDNYLSNDSDFDCSQGNQRAKVNNYAKKGNFIVVGKMSTSFDSFHFLH